MAGGRLQNAGDAVADGKMIVSAFEDEHLRCGQRRNRLPDTGVVFSLQVELAGRVVSIAVHAKGDDQIVRREILEPGDGLDRGGQFARDQLAFGFMGPR